jgi:succinate-semialdehyde dehydrogenase/glutarate-semialdehyde dehydrogenase
MSLEVVNPATGVVVRRFEATTFEQCQEAVALADSASLAWRRNTFEVRARAMREAGRILRDRAPHFARLMAEEMGKPITDGIAEANKCALTCDFYAENAGQFLRRQNIEQGNNASFISFQPIGVVLAIMPWNFPFWQVFRFAAPALMAGNAGLLKHASNVPGCALAIESVFREAGFPEHLFRTLLIGGRQAEALIEHPLVQAVTLTGSTPAGRAVAAKAGVMLKKTVLELGGSDPYLILADADLEFAAAACARGRLVNAGQSCVAAKRFIVVDKVLREFERLLVASMKRVRMGDPLDETTQIGPLARLDLRDELHKQVTDSIALGAECLCGGRIPDGPGAFYPPTVLSNVRKGMPAYGEEMFGPVASVIAVKSVEEAIAVANDSPFGLGGGVFTSDVVLGERLAEEELQTGLAFVNGTVVSDPKLPFGGVKQSGYGRELSSYGILEFVNVKSIVVTRKTAPVNIEGGGTE